MGVLGPDLSKADFVPPAEGYYRQNSKVDFDLIKALQRQAGACVKSAETTAAKAEAEGRDVTAEEEKEISKNLDRAKFLRDKATSDANRMGIPSTGDLMQQARDSFFNVLQGKKPEAPAIAKGKSWSDLFGASDLGQWENPHQFLSSVILGMADPRLEFQAAMGGKTGSAGGWMVPSELSRIWLDGAFENEKVRPLARVYPMLSDTLNVPGFTNDDSTNPSNLGSLAWLHENAVATKANPTIRKITLIAKKAAIFVALSNEIVADANGLVQALGQQLASALALGLDDAFLNGSGAGMPLGVLNGPALVVQAKETNQLATTINYKNVIGMWGRLLPSSAGNSVWFCHPSALPQLMAITIPIMNIAATENVGGGTIQLFADSNGQLSFLGRPLIISEKMQPLGSQGDILLADFSYYGVGLRQDFLLETSNAVGWTADQFDIRLKVRVDGQPLIAKATTPRHGSATLSPFVTLAAR